jgi:acyl-coenzyme A thioesterase PaaI-like protein
LEIDAAAGRASFYPGRSVANALGAIQGGVTITAMTHAAAALVSHELSAPAAATDIHVYYTGLGTVGPYEVRSELLRCDGAEALVRNELVDTGADDRLLALGTVSARAC